MSTKIIGVRGRQILDSRGNPTVEADVILEGGIRWARRRAVRRIHRRARSERTARRRQVPLHGKGVLKAVGHVNAEITKAVVGMDAADQRAVDRRMIEADGTPNKANFGANAILAVSMATARAAAAAAGKPLYNYLAVFRRPVARTLLPVPMMNILNGGAHADNSVDVQEFMVMPIGAPNFHEALRWGVEVFHNLKTVLKKNGYSTAVGDEGGFAPNLKSNEEALERVLEAITAAGYKPGEQISIALDPAASEFYDSTKKRTFSRNPTSRSERPSRWSSSGHLGRQYPIISIEDGLAEDDWDGWKLITRELGKQIQLVGDDVFVTNPKIFARGIAEGIGTPS